MDNIRKKKRGPTPRPPDQLRRHQVNCRLTDDELNHVNKNRGGMSPGEFIRTAALKKKLPRPVPSINQKKWSELARLAGNLNQLIRYINQNPFIEIQVDSNLIKKIKNEVQVLRLELLTGERKNEGKDM